MFLASCYPSRSGVPAYVEYQRDVEALVDVINERWATPRWTPIVYDTTDDYPRSVAVLRRADVVLVNPIRDGLNLVAKEAAIVNDRDVVVCLSTEAGVWDELSDAVVQVQPFDVAGTADALGEGTAHGRRRAALTGEAATAAGRGAPPGRLAVRPARGRRGPALGTARPVRGRQRRRRARRQLAQQVEDGAGPVHHQVGAFDQVAGGLVTAPRPP